jgi:hypothetical protein
MRLAATRLLVKTNAIAAMHARKAAIHQAGGEKANVIVRPSEWSSWVTERKSQDLLHEWSLSSDVRLSIARVPPSEVTLQGCVGVA